MSSAAAAEPSRPALALLPATPATPATVDPATLRAAFRRAPAPIAVLTTTFEGRPAGLTVTSLRSLSADPALVTFGVTRTASAFPALHAAPHVLVHLLEADHQHVAQRFATSGVDRFAEPLAWAWDEAGLPRLAAAAVVLRARVEARHAHGDAVLFVAAVEAVEHASSGAPLVYADGGYIVLSRRPTSP